MSEPSLQALEAERKKIKSQLAEIGDMRPGSMVERFRKCGKPNCHCCEPNSAGHGPSWSLTRRVQGKTVTTVVPTGPAVQRAQQQLNEYRRFRQLIQQLVEVNVQICDYQLQRSSGSPDDKKNASERRPKLGRRRRSRSASRG